jgi:hypothetical protein
MFSAYALIGAVVWNPYRSFELEHPKPLNGDRLMMPSEEFMRHAAECELMAKFARNPEDKKVWSRMSERWIRCAELAHHDEALPQGRNKAKADRRPDLA